MTLIICCGMSRSAGTLQYQLVKHLVEQYADGKGCGSLMNVEEHRRKKFIVVKKEPFVPLENIPFDDIYLAATYRDARDVAVSLFGYRYRKAIFSNSTLPMWKNVLDEFESVISWISKWEAAGAAMFRYEDYFPDKWSSMVSKIARDLEIDMGPNTARDICYQYTRKRNIERMQHIRGWMDMADSMLTKEHISPNIGKPCQWENLLPKEVLGSVNEIAGEWLKEHGYD